ncbi:hypothetical protein JL722_4249 [Aureococcus anophagefferens]|nr:hypothetical protein JL722_4249 [Aureococcus anophagefferens]
MAPSRIYVAPTPEPIRVKPASALDRDAEVTRLRANLGDEFGDDDFDFDERRRRGGGKVTVVGRASSIAPPQLQQATALSGTPPDDATAEVATRDAEPAHPPNDDGADAAGLDEDHYFPAVANSFTPLSAQPTVARLSASAALVDAERALLVDAELATAKMKPVVANIAAALAKSIDYNLNTKDISGTCLRVVQSYGSPEDRATAAAREAWAAASADVTQLYLGAAKARVAFEPRVRAFLSARCASADVRRVGVAAASSRRRRRGKRLLRCDAPGSADGICDFVRGTVVVGSLDDVRAVLAGALGWADVELAEPEDSFARDPPVGVGRELALYFWFRDDARKHVCELVVRHEALEAVARRIPGHGRFVHAVRYAAALLDYKYRDLTLRGVSRDVMPALGALGPSAVAIADFWRDCGGPRWKNARGWMASPDLGSWHGLTVDELKRISVLKLDRNGLTGRIPESIGLLTGLRYLGGLEHLKFLDLHENQLSGEIPGELGNATNLERLYLHNNDLTGEVPRALGALIHLKYAYLHNNPLTISPKMPTDAQGELSFRTEGETLTFVAYLRSDEASCACALM